MGAGEYGKHDTEFYHVFRGSKECLCQHSYVLSEGLKEDVYIFAFERD